MQATIDVIKEAIFQQKENLTKFNEDREDLVRHISHNYKNVNDAKLKIETLERELTQLYNSQSESMGFNNCTSDAQLYKDSISSDIKASHRESYPRTGSIRQV